MRNKEHKSGARELVRKHPTIGTGCTGFYSITSRQQSQSDVIVSRRTGVNLNHRLASHSGEFLRRVKIAFPGGFTREFRIVFAAVRDKSRFEVGVHLLKLPHSLERPHSPESGKMSSRS